MAIDANRSLHLGPARRDGDETLYTLSVDGPHGPAVLGFVVEGARLRILAWPDGDAAIDVGELTLPDA